MPPHPSPSGSAPFIKCGIVPPSFLNHFGTEKQGNRRTRDSGQLWFRWQYRSLVGKISIVANERWWTRQVKDLCKDKNDKSRDPRVGLFRHLILFLWAFVAPQTGPGKAVVIWPTGLHPTSTTGQQRFWCFSVEKRRKCSFSGVCARHHKRNEAAGHLFPVIVVECFGWEAKQKEWGGRTWWEQKESGCAANLWEDRGGYEEGMCGSAFQCWTRDTTVKWDREEKDQGKMAAVLSIWLLPHSG